MVVDVPQSQAGENGPRGLAFGLARRRQAGVSVPRLAVIGGAQQSLQAVKDVFVVKALATIGLVRLGTGNLNVGKRDEFLQDRSPCGRKPW